jgi:hypothetical protein
MRSFQSAATQLALLRDGMQRGLNRKPRDVDHAIAEERRLLAAIGEHRAVYVGRDPRTPPAVWDGRGYQITFPDGVTRGVAAPEDPVMPVPVRLPTYPYGGYGGYR